MIMMKMHGTPSPNDLHDLPTKTMGKQNHLVYEYIL